MASIRILRLQKELKKLFTLALQNKSKDDRLKELVITEVSVSKDLRYAKIYFSFGYSEGNVNKALKALNFSKGFFKNTIAQAKLMRTIPELSFYFDETLKNANRLEELFDKINKEG